MPGTIFHGVDWPFEDKPSLGTMSMVSSFRGCPQLASPGACILRGIAVGYKSWTVFDSAGDGSGNPGVSGAPRPGFSVIRSNLVCLEAWLFLLGLFSFCLLRGNPTELNISWETVFHGNAAWFSLSLGRSLSLPVHLVP